MFHYEKKLQFPVKIATPNPKLAAFIISQYGGPYSIRLQKPERFAPAYFYSALRRRSQICAHGAIPRTQRIRHWF
jgi:hypothetical protein